MISDQKIKTNRANAQKSTGPRTAEGKQAVSQNALTHGLRARNAVLLMENNAEFQQLLADYRQEWQPTGPTQDDLVEQLVVNKWKMARYEAAESHACMQCSLIHLALHDPREFQTEKGTIKYPSLDTKRELDAERTLARVSQHISRLERAYFRALQVLQRLQGARPQQQSGQTDPLPTPPQPPQPKVLTAGATCTAKAATPVPIRRSRN